MAHIILDPFADVMGGEPRAREGGKLQALLEVVLIAHLGPYVLARVLLLPALLGDVSLMGWAFEGHRELLASAVLRGVVGWMIYLPMVAIVFRYGALREAIASLRGSPARAGWIFALITAGMQCIILVSFFVTDAQDLWEPSFFNVYMSLFAALGGGVGEELAYRGIVVLRLRTAGFSEASQVVISGLLFGLAHASWSGTQAGANLLIIAMPVVGTALLGGLLARAFQLSGYRILPVIVAHALINLVIEPALLLSYFPG